MLKRTLETAGEPSSRMRTASQHSNHRIRAPSCAPYDRTLLDELERQRDRERKRKRRQRKKEREPPEAE
jgi:hypothetical protein